VRRRRAKDLLRTHPTLSGKNRNEYLAHRGFEDESDLFPLISLDNGDEHWQKEDLDEPVPVLALKNTVLFPSNVIPITIGRDRSILAIQQSFEKDKIIAVVSQRDIQVEEPQVEDLFPIGTIARILKMLKMPDGTTTAILRGIQRVEVQEITREEPHLEGRVLPLEYEEAREELTYQATIDSVRDLAQRAVELSPNLPSQASVMLSNIEDPVFLVNFIAGNLNSKVQQKQMLLEDNNLGKRAIMLLELLQHELQILELRDRIEERTR